MKQQDFIWISRNVRAGEISQDAIGNTIVHLRPQIQVTHNYKKGIMMIIFVDDKARFIIPDRTQLEHLYKLHLAHDDVIQILREYCKQNFERK